MTSEVESILRQALFEDQLNIGDITTMATIPSELQTRAVLLVKEDGIICGLDVMCKLFALVSTAIKVELLKQDGDSVSRGEIAAYVSGNARDIISTERVALNLVQRMSGIATMTHKMVKQAFPAKVLDTRKTVPGLRVLDKWAVVRGGGFNHRFGLYDQFLIKDNHIDACGSMEKAILSVKTYKMNQNLSRAKVIVEARSLDEVRACLKHVDAIDRILLDNMSIEDMSQAVLLVGGQVDIEASGNMDLEKVKQVSATGVGFISVGCLTHSVKALDISLKVNLTS